MKHLANFCKAIFRDFRRNLDNICAYMCMQLVFGLFFWGISELSYEKIKFTIVNYSRLFFKTIFIISLSFFALLLIVYLCKSMIFITKSIAHYLKSKWRDPEDPPPINPKNDVPLKEILEDTSKKEPKIDIPLKDKSKEESKSRYDLAREQ
jgi:hypothetical protein